MYLACNGQYVVCVRDGFQHGHPFLRRQAPVALTTEKQHALVCSSKTRLKCTNMWVICDSSSGHCIALNRDE